LLTLLADTAWLGVAEKSDVARAMSVKIARIFTRDFIP